MAAARDSRAASFGPTAAAYARARPGYPDDAVAWLVPQPPARILDLGAGTGKLTASLVARGHEVVAVDPSPPMLDELRRCCPRVEALVGAAEAVPLPDQAFDAIVVAQAWHWVDPARAVAEIARLLRPGGTLGLVWNIRDKAAVWMPRYERIVDLSETPAFDGVPIVPAPLREDGTASFRWVLPFDEPGLLDLAASRSAFPIAPEARQRAMRDEVRAFFDEIAQVDDDGRRVLRMPYVTRGFRYRLG